MKYQSSKTFFSMLLLIALVLVSVGTAFAKSLTGPSSSKAPYMTSSRKGVDVKSILTVGDSVNLKPDGTPYRMVGLADGLGAFENEDEGENDDREDDDTFTLLMNHEIGTPSGIVRAHGAPGAFISKWIINKDDLRVIHGEDLIKNVLVWNTTTGQYEEATVAQKTFVRFCSADLPGRSAFYDDGLGYKGRIFMNGEEAGAEGRAFAHLMDGTSYELPHLGKFSWENSIANSETGIKTVVAGTDDSAGGQVYFYVGTKTDSDNPVDAAGLTNGELFSIKVDGVDAETNSTVLSGPASFTAYNFGDVSAWSGAKLEAESKDASGAFRVTSFQRPEDGAWDPRHPNDFYFVTTASFTGNSRLWVIHFNDASDPSAGGTVEILLDGTEGQKMMDNLTITEHGQIIIQEDPGNQAYLAKIWSYDIRRDKLTEIAQHDAALFTPGSAGFLTQDEESSGIIDASEIIDDGWFLMVQETHARSTDVELVEGGQLLAIRIKR